METISPWYFLSAEVIKKACILPAVQAKIRLKRFQQNSLLNMVFIFGIHLTLIPVSFFPTYSPWHALVTRYLNKMKQIVTIFLARSLPDSVAKRITRQTSDRKDCSSNSPGGECIYNSNQKEDGREKYNMVILDPFYLNGLKFGSKKFIYIKKGIKYIKNESLKL